jgi:hypothetical protein
VTPTVEPSHVPSGQPITTPKSVGSSPRGSQGTVPAPTPPTINTASLPDGITGRTYSATLSASGARPFSWVKAGGNLSSGLTLSSTGDITGTINSTGTVTFTVKVTDGNGLSASRTLSITSTHLQADINYDGQVNCYEYNIVKANYGKSPATYQQGDINQNGTSTYTT